MGCQGGSDLRVEFRYTKHQVPRGSRPDAVSGNQWYLFKNVSELRLTYQVRMLTFAARQSGVPLIVRVPSACKISRPLQDFCRENRKALRIERV